MYGERRPKEKSVASTLAKRKIGRGPLLEKPKGHAHKIKRSERGRGAIKYNRALLRKPETPKELFKAPAIIWESGSKRTARGSS